MTPNKLELLFHPVSLFRRQARLTLRPGRRGSWLF